jgi:hypothetical protein
LGTEIEISSGKSLQDAINDGSLVKRDGGWSPCINDFKECNNPIPFCGGNNCPEDAGSDGIEFCGTYLVNNVHTGLDCTNAGGVISTGFKGYEGTDPFCIFSDFRRYFDISCPSGWTQLQYWSTTVSLTCSQLKSAYDSGCQSPCTTGSHNFDNIDPLTEACTAYMGDRDCKWNGCHCNAGPSYLCIPNKKQIGCY